MPQPILVSWSTGKDSAWALHRLRSDPDFEVRGLLTTLGAERRRVAAHGVREELLAAQVRALGLPLRRVYLPEPCSNAEYEARMADALGQARREGITGLAFADLFLEDIRRYREQQLRRLGLRPHFPLWGRDTGELAREMVDAGLRARLVCVDPARCPRELAGRDFDASLLRRLPADVDPCGENGEFHTYAHAGPMFSEPIPVRTTGIGECDGFVFADLELGGAPAEQSTPATRAHPARELQSSLSRAPFSPSRDAQCAQQ